MNRYFLKIFILFCYFANAVSAQTPVNEAETLFNTGKFAKAAALYVEFLAKNPKDALANYQLARCYYELHDFDKAIPLFEKAKIKFPVSNYYLGLIYQNLYKFKEAESAFATYLKAVSETQSPQFFSDAAKRENQTAMASEMLNRIEDITLIDSIIVDKNNFLNAYKISPDLGSINVKNISDKNKNYDIASYTTQRGNRKIFSDMNGSQLDIFTAYKLTNADWSEKSPVSANINTEYDENFPFMMTDGITLYFASNSDKSIGGYDIFTTRFNSEKNDFYAPENIGMPFNSPFNDYMMVVDDNRGIGWFASDRFQPEGKVVIYRFIPNKEKKIIRSENIDSLINFAKLKIARKPDSLNNNFYENMTENIISRQNADFQFIVNDKTIYYSVSEFKSSDAAALANQLINIKIDLQNIKNQLNILRNQYAAASEDEKKNLAPQILEKEQLVQKLEQNVNETTVSIRNLEINELNQ